MLTLVIEMKIKTKDYKTNEIIKIKRECVDRTQDDFAKECKMSRSSLQKYEYGTVNYSFETLVNIAKIYGFEITIESTSKTDKMSSKN